MKKVIIAIPARYSSERFPGKPLALIKEKPMIRWVYEKGEKVSEILNKKFNVRVLIATDDERIKRVSEEFGAEVIMTPPHLPSGTDRIYYATKNFDYDFILNLQGDEPLIYEKDLENLIEEGVKNDYPCTTLVHRTSVGYNDPDIVKVVFDKSFKVLYFSRAPIPYGREKNPTFFYKHIGVYFMRKDVIEKFVNLGESELEKIEKLEQLRLLENGIPIYCVLAERNTIPVDRREDIEKVAKFI